MEQFHHYFSIFCDIVIMSLFIWHSRCRTKKINQDIHSLKKKAKECSAYRNNLRRVQ